MAEGGEHNLKAKSVNKINLK